MIKLAIVIPAFKSQFLSQTLDSLCAQTNQSFNVYIGDDCSTESIRSIVESYKNRLNLSYQRFNNNLGGKSLTAQWNRCIDLVQDEKWIWLLPDDDFASPDCVENFIKESTGDILHQNLYRFNTIHLDEENNVCFEPKKCPKYESNIDFIINKLSFKRNSSVAEYIFSKEAYYKVGRFVHLPLAWGSDDLLWIKLSQQNDIITIENGTVYLHQSSVNISNNKYDFTKQKFSAKYMMFVKLLSDKCFYNKLNSLNKLEIFQSLLLKHLFYEYKSHNIEFGLVNTIRYAYLNNRLFGGGFLKNIYRIIRHVKSK